MATLQHLWVLIRQPLRLLVPADFLVQHVAARQPCPALRHRLVAKEAGCPVPGRNLSGDTGVMAEPPPARSMAVRTGGEWLRHWPVPVPVPKE